MRKIASTFAVVALATATIAATPQPERALNWNVDASHTRIGFKVNHFFTPVAGQFDEFDATVDFDPANPEAASVEVTIPVASINTNNERRDAHLLSPDFFDAENYPTITFRSTSVRQVGENEFVAVGDLTIKETTRQVELPIRLQGLVELPAEMQEQFGGIEQVASFTAETAVNRNDFGVGAGNWAATAIIGGDVSIDIQIEVNR